MTTQGAYAPETEIVLASDLRCRCDRALDRARMLALAARARLCVVTGVERDFHDPSWRSAKHETLEAVRAELAQEFEGSGFVWDLAVEAADPAEIAVSTAGGRGARLIVPEGVSA